MPRCHGNRCAAGTAFTPTWSLRTPPSREAPGEAARPGRGTAPGTTERPTGRNARALLDIPGPQFWRDRDTGIANAQWNLMGAEWGPRLPYTSVQRAWGGFRDEVNPHPLWLHPGPAEAYAQVSLQGEVVVARPWEAGGEEVRAPAEAEWEHREEAAERGNSPEAATPPEAGGAAASPWGPQPGRV